VIYWAFVGVTRPGANITSTRARAQARAGGQLGQAQLQVLKDAVHPHFLFNTLHTISA